MSNAENQPTVDQSGRSAPLPTPTLAKRVLHVGSGPKRAEKLHPVFRSDGWAETRLDVDPGVRPDITVDITDMTSIATDSFDAIWCSHCLEHLDDHRARAALGEFHRILSPAGFALITSPDLQVVARLVAEGREEDVVYTAPAGDVRPLDMMFGFQPAVAAGNGFMRHHTGFSRKRLGTMMRDVGFSETRIAPGRSFDLWALGFKPEADRDAILNALLASGINFHAPSNGE